MASSISEKIEYLMYFKHIKSKAELSRLSNIPYSTIASLWDRGADNTKRSTLLALAKVFEVSTDFLADDSREISSIDDQKDMLAYTQKNPNLRILFTKAKGLKKEDIDFVIQMIQRMEKEGVHHDDK